GLHDTTVVGSCISGRDRPLASCSAACAPSSTPTGSSPAAPTPPSIGLAE
ncbi:hypothetical protein EE612_022191, partial [Oryza sativa]